MSVLRGRNVLLGVTGGIAAYKAAEVASRLIKAGAHVRVTMTPAATHFVAPLTFQALTHYPVAVEMFALLDRTEIAHVSLAQWADLFVIAPLTASTLAKLATGQADNLLTATALATRAPLLLAPAMESHMWTHPQTQANLARVREWGAVIVGPESGRLASGATGPGRMAEPVTIVDAAEATLGRNGPLAGRRVVVTAGGTQEPIDPVRVLSNRSSGKMGLALARAARNAGADVTLIHTPSTPAPPWGVTSVLVRTAEEMRDAVMQALGQGAEILLMAAAVADYRPAEVAAEKRKKGSASWVLRLVPNPDILAEVAERRASWPSLQVVVGFAAETEDLVAHAREKLIRKRLDLIVANDARAAMGSETNQVTLIAADGTVVPWPELSKDEVAARLVEHVARLSSQKQ